MILKQIQFNGMILEHIGEWQIRASSHIKKVLKNYTTLVEGPKGPQVTEHFNTICT